MSCFATKLTYPHGEGVNLLLQRRMRGWQRATDEVLAVKGNTEIEWIRFS
jgi:hypothetical protein